VSADQLETALQNKNIRKGVLDIYIAIPVGLTIYRKLINGFCRIANVIRLQFCSFANKFKAIAGVELVNRCGRSGE
jgi:hypothetical protein